MAMSHVLESRFYSYFCCPYIHLSTITWYTVYPGRAQWISTIFGWSKDLLDLKSWLVGRSDDVLFLMCYLFFLLCSWWRKKWNWVLCDLYWTIYRLDVCGPSVCWNPNCRCIRLLPKSQRLRFSGFLPLDVSSPAVWDILRSTCCRCVRCRGSQRTVSSSV